MVLAKRNYRRDIKGNPKQIVFVNSIQKGYQELNLEAFGLSIEKYESTSEPPRVEPGTIYVLEEFENNSLVEAFHSVETWVLGTTCLAEMVLDLRLELRSKPTYCTSMFGYCYYVNCPGNISLTKRLVRLIKWMGGKFVRQPNQHMTHMITDTVLSNGYHYCYTFQVPVLTPHWIEHCWNQRNTVGFKAISTMDSFKLAAFEGLSIYFMGFASDEYAELEKLTKNNGGAVVSFDDSSCTHMVIKEQIVSEVNEKDFPPSALFIVSCHWFWSSLEQNQRDYEFDYRCDDLLFSNKIIKWINETSTESNGRLAVISQEINNSEHSTNEAPGEQTVDCDAQNRKNKRMVLCQELYDTEKNYLQCLKNLINMKCQITNSDQKGGPILSESHSQQMFGNAEKMFLMHQQLVKQLETVNSEIEICQLFMNIKNDLKNEYTDFAKQHKIIMKSFEYQLEKNRRFRKLVDSLSKEPNTHHPKDLFMRPIQRMFHICEILKRLRKNVGDELNKDIINKATKTIENILENMNRSIN